MYNAFDDPLDLKCIRLDAEMEAAYQREKRLEHCGKENCRFDYGSDHCRTECDLWEESQ